MPGDELRLQITGDAPPNFYLGGSPNGTNINPILVPANNKVTIEVADFAVPDYSSFRYITAVITSSSITTNARWNCCKQATLWQVHHPGSAIKFRGVFKQLARDEWHGDYRVLLVVKKRLRKNPGINCGTLK